MNSMMMIASGKMNKAIYYDMGYINLVDTRQKEKVMKMSNQELNSIIVGQTIVLALMFVVVVLLMTNN